MKHSTRWLTLIMNMSIHYDLRSSVYPVSGVIFLYWPYFVLLKEVMLDLFFTYMYTVYLLTLHCFLKCL